MVAAPPRPATRGASPGSCSPRATRSAGAPRDRHALAGRDQVKRRRRNAILARARTRSSSTGCRRLCLWPERRWVHAVRLTAPALGRERARRRTDAATLRSAAATALRWAGAAPLVLGGDFNLRGPRSTGSSCAAATTSTHIFVRDLSVAGGAEVLDRGRLSDHAPVAVSDRCAAPPARRSRARPSRPSRCRTAARGRTRSRAGSPGRPRSPAICAASVSAMSIPEETPAAVMTLPCSTTRRLTGRRAQACRARPSSPSAWSPRARRGCRRRRVRASQCTPTWSTAEVSCDGADPVEHPLVVHQLASAVAARDHDHLGCGDVVEGPVGGERRACRPRCAWARPRAPGNGRGRREAATGPRRDRSRRVRSTRRRSGSRRPRCRRLPIPAGAQPEAAQHQQRLLAERPALRAAPRAGSRRRTGRRTRGRAAAARAAPRSRRSQWTTTNRLVAGRPSSGARWVPSSLHGAATNWSLASRSPVRSRRASGKPAHSRAACSAEQLDALESARG